MRKPHYAWFVCLGGALSLFTVMGLGVNIFSIYQPEIIAFNGFSNAQGSWITTTRSLFILGTLLCVNQLCARFGLRLVMTLGMTFVGLSCFCFGASTNFPMYCASAALTGIGYCLGGMVPLSLIIANWFDSRRGLALGIAAAGSGVSTIFAPAIITRLIQEFGLRTAFFCEGAFILVVAATGFLLLRTAPADKGLEPYRIEAQSPTARSVQPEANHGRLPVVLLLAAAFLLGGPLGPAFSHLTVLYTSEGFEPMAVAGLVSYMGLAICVSKVVCGQMYDRLGGRLSNTWVLGGYFVGHLLCCLAFTKSLVLAYLAITVFSFGISVSAVSPAVWARDLTGSADYAKTVRAITTAYTFGMLVMGPIPGILADRFGSYVPAYAFFALCQLVLTLIIQGIYFKLDLGKRPVRT